MDLANYALCICHVEMNYAQFQLKALYSGQMCCPMTLLVAITIILWWEGTSGAVGQGCDVPRLDAIAFTCLPPL